MEFSTSLQSSLLILVLFAAVVGGQAQLSTTFYSRSCPNLTAIISQGVSQILAADPNLAGGLQRLHFHDCFVRGCDASVLLNSASSSNQEKDALPNQGSLRGFQQIDQIKTAVEAACPRVVSCADILAIVARDATVTAGGPSWPVLLGRRDGRVSLASEALAALPSPLFNFSQLVQSFAAVGLNTTEMIVLSGAHTFGRARCGPVLPRLYNFGGVVGLTDPSMDANLAANLKRQCPPNDVRTFIRMDSSPNTFDNIYYKQVATRQGLFITDAALLTDSGSGAIVNQLANSSSSWFSDFAAAMVKMSQIQVLTGSAGEIRRRCSVTN